MDEYTYDTTPKSKEHEDEEAYDDYMDVEEPNPFPMEDIDADMDSTSHPIYDMYDDAYMIVLRDDELGEGAPKHEEGLAWDELIVEDDFISHEEDNEGMK